MAAYRRANTKLADGQHDEAAKEFKAGLEQAPTPDLYGVRFMLEYGLAKALFSQNRFAEAKGQLQAALANPTRRAETLSWAYLQLAPIAKKLNDQSTLRWAVDAATTADAAAGGRTGAAEQARRLLDSASKN